MYKPYKINQMSLLTKITQFFKNLGSEHRQKVRDVVLIVQKLKQAIDSKEVFFIATVIPGKWDDVARHKLSVLLGTVLKELKLIQNIGVVLKDETKELSQSRPFNEIAGTLLSKQTGVSVDLAKEQVELEYQTNKHLL